jgi:hypothetical protein
MRYDQRHRKGADCRGRTQPTETNRSAVQNLICENRHQCGRASQQDREQIQSDRCQDHFSLKYKAESGHEAFPRAGLALVAPLFAAPNRKNQKEKAKRAQRIQQVHKRKPDVGNEQSTECRTHNGSNLKNAVVPGDRICKGITRNQRRKK